MLGVVLSPQTPFPKSEGVLCVKKTLGTNKQANKTIPNQTKPYQTKPKHTQPYQTKTSKTKPKPTKHILFFLKGLVVYPSFFRKRHLGKVSALTQIDSIVLTILPFPRRLSKLHLLLEIVLEPNPSSIFWWKKILPPENERVCPLERNHVKRKIIFQPSFFRGYVSFQGSIFMDSMVHFFLAKLCGCFLQGCE